MGVKVKLHVQSAFTPTSDSPAEQSEYHIQSEYFMVWISGPEKPPRKTAVLHSVFDVIDGVRWRIKDQLDVTCHFISFHSLCAQHVSDINTSIIRSLRLFCWIITLDVLFLVRCVLEFRCVWVGVVSVLQASACNTDTTPIQPHRNSNTSNHEQYDQCVNSTE